MKLLILAVGQKMPDWAEIACADYERRFGHDYPLTIKTVKAENRHVQKPVQVWQQTEQNALLNACPKQAIRVALDERGQPVTTLQLAHWLKTWQQRGDPVAFFLGGPDGMTSDFTQQMPYCLRLSNMTLPHALARVVLIEQLYRATSILLQHPYHRA